MKDRVPPGAAEVHFVGNATLLLRYGPFTLLTDPNLLHRGRFAHLGYGLVTRRLTEPALPPGGLPYGLDAVVLSHLHGDHWDRAARRRLHRGLPVLTTPHAARRLQGLQGFHRATGLATWQSHDLVKEGCRVRVTSVPGRHAGTAALRRLLPPVMGSVVEFDQGGEVTLRLYLSGDTLPFDGLREITEHFPDIHLGVFHLGGTRLPGGFVVTMDGRQGGDLLDIVDPAHVLPVHYDDYTVMRSPLSDFVAEAGRRGFGDRLVHCPRGAGFVAGPGPRVGEVRPAVARPGSASTGGG
ncbi:L-ascorbate metabolism protein UlaG, beta-lactamase superfamily [Streptomyces sp. WMMB 714]|uniref:MBL fold metallo-hydrolase n=1 Tax=Streptomyces sp. WMMB 714 TaxID=1286822 RepID=UPI0005F7F69E|nr:MBL fold metallo-hydrolase [Streptomyces sp. WMMB 714]SCK32159.1 L-ascorbate metabolism protein UlaG, beta-lactamase superfamily [Streptomyces sp. WMMB 714]